MEQKITENENYIIYARIEISSNAFFEYLDSILTEEKSKALISYLLEKNMTEVLLIKNIWVNKEERSKGYGKKLINQALSQNKDLPALLLADYLETQVGNFSIIDWYSKLGFTTIPFFSISGPFMIKTS